MPKNPGDDGRQSLYAHIKLGDSGAFIENKWPTVCIEEEKIIGAFVKKPVFGLFELLQNFSFMTQPEVARLMNEKNYGAAELSFAEALVVTNYNKHAAGRILWQCHNDESVNSKARDMFKKVGDDLAPLVLKVYKDATMTHDTGVEELTLEGVFRLLKNDFVSAGNPEVRLKIWDKLEPLGERIGKFPKESVETSDNGKTAEEMTEVAASIQKGMNK